ncbi:MAG: RnfABCDGE type electron transport complex subunit G [Paludibacter sp.]|jgi:electron transport complex protein RnfG|nr:RnfABCDGE type electron transport complex subunit G [Paludibacter sp.]
MAKLESTFKNMVLVLTGITIFAAVALGSVYSLTKEPIAASKKAKQENAIKEVLPEYDRLEAEELITLDGFETPFALYKAYKGDTFVGAAVQSYSGNGFSGEIKVMVGFDAEGSIVNYSVLEQKETPGLGTKMGDWFKTEKANQDIRGKHPETNNLTVSKDGGEVDAITAATISSRAFLETIRYAYSAYSQSNTTSNEVALSTDSVTVNQ